MDGPFKQTEIRQYRTHFKAWPLIYLKKYIIRELLYESAKFCHIHDIFQRYVSLEEHRKEGRMALFNKVGRGG